MYFLAMRWKQQLWDVMRIQYSLFPLSGGSDGTCSSSCALYSLKGNDTLNTSLTHFVWVCYEILWKTWKTKLSCWLWSSCLQQKKNMVLSWPLLQPLGHNYNNSGKKKRSYCAYHWVVCLDGSFPMTLKICLKYHLKVFPKFHTQHFHYLFLLWNKLCDLLL